MARATIKNLTDEQIREYRATLGNVGVDAHVARSCCDQALSTSDGLGLTQKMSTHTSPGRAVTRRCRPQMGSA